MFNFATTIDSNLALSTEILLIALIIAYGILLARAVPPKAHIPVNLLATAATIALGYVAGLSLADMGLANFGKGLIVGGAVSLVIVIGTILISNIPPLKKFFVAEGHARAQKGKLIFEAAVRIPLSTALLEETLFRGVLLGLLLTTESTTVALVVSSVIFGLWHILPAWDSLAKNDAAMNALGGKKSRKFAGVFGVVIVTGIAGALFSWLRLASGSLLAPWLVHWAINSSSTIASALHMQGDKKSKS